MAKDAYEISLWRDIPVAASLHTYKWQVDTGDGRGWHDIDVANYPSAVTPTLTFKPKSTSWNGYKYQCVINFGGNTQNSVTSGEAVLTVKSSIADGEIISMSGDRQVAEGEEVSFSVNLGSTKVKKYIWQRNKNDGEGWKNISATSYPSSRTPNLTFYAKSDFNGIKYHCVVTLANNTQVTSDVATLSVTDSNYRITKSPDSITVVPDTIVNMSVEASGEIPSYYDEEKLAVIGSDTMTSNCRAYDPHLVENINGTHTFTFKMYMKYTEKFNEGEKLDNPFLSLLVNERKVKVFWKDEWYDLVIKKIQENSSDKSITYTCTDTYINELSKNGFNLEFATELENNQGTAEELAARVLEDTDWQLAPSDTIQQEKEEPVYEVQTQSEFKAINDSKNSATLSTIPNNSKILIYYNQVQEIVSKVDAGATTGTLNLQFGYNSSYNRDTNSQLVINADCYSVEDVTWKKLVNNNNTNNDDSDDTNYIKFEVTQNSTVKNIGIIYYESGVSDQYRAKRLIKSQKCILDPLTGKYVYIYNAIDDNDSNGAYEIGDVIYKYESTLYKDPTIVNNILVNSSNFSLANGWRVTGNNTANLYPELYPLYTTWIQDESHTDIVAYNAETYLHFPKSYYGDGDSRNYYYYNAGLRESSNFTPEGYQRGEVYIFRCRAMGSENNHPSGSYITNIQDVGLAIRMPVIREFKETNGVISLQGSQYFEFENGVDLPGGWIEYRGTCKKSITRNEIYSKNLGFFFRTSAELWLESAEFFPEVFDSNGDRINPGEMEKQSIAQPYYYYYNHTKSEGLISADDINYISITSEDPDYTDFEAVYNDNFEKIRSIEIKESNRFNILQTIAETFECWMKFEIQHDPNYPGKVLVKNGIPQKFVSIKKNVGEDVGIGFIYGIDLKAVQRNIQSDQIVTKTIVRPNSNEFGIDGFCTIARSNENYPRVNYILNLDYYITQGLLDSGELSKDLYLSTGDIGYFYNLHNLNVQYDSLINTITQKEMELAKQESYDKLYENYMSSLSQEIQNLESQVMYMAKVNTYAAATQFIKDNPNYADLAERMNAHENAKRTREEYSGARTKLQVSIAELKAALDELKETQENVTNSIKELDLKFYKKYSRFLQEGTWTSENYIDDNLYYLDAQSVAYTASRPQISYDISVIRISSLPDFENKVFHCGDISFVQDPEFFGYVEINGTKTPYKEQVIVSEVHSYFDSPDKDMFKVQNYRTQFEDLFQRITAATQSLQYASGGYARAASVVETDGTIKPETLQSSIAVNEQLVYSANNESIVQDSTGVTVTNLSNPNEKTKVTSGGVFITTDGGATWKNAIRGEGVATQYLTSGSVNTNKIMILDGEHSTFRWDSTGINAYYQTENGINLGRFVRFDQYGIYGITSGSSEYHPEDEDDIKDTAAFGLTWSGLFIKNRYNNYYIEVSNENDIRLVYNQQNNNSVDLIKIGKLSNDAYGIRFKDKDGNVTLETDNNGNLWLQNALHIGTTTSGDYEVSIGRLPVVNQSKQIIYDQTNLDTRTVDGNVGSDLIHRSISVNNKFAVWEDGTMYAKDGYFEGTINATSGAFTGHIIATSGAINGDFNINSILHIGDNVSIGQIETPKNPDVQDGIHEVFNANNNFIVYSDGSIKAVEGSFSGDISAATGTIGGFNISENSLISQDNNIQLFGTEGKIVANVIELGTGAVINDYIRLGAAQLLNPTPENGGKILTTQDNSITLTDAGVLKIGNIVLDGPNSTIYGTNWSITDEEAIFNNIIAKGNITATTSIFRNETVQTVGGIMIFRPTYEVESFEQGTEQTTITLSENVDTAINSDHYVNLIDTTGKSIGIYKPFSVSGKVLTFNSQIEADDLYSVIDYGVDGSILIGINSTPNDVEGILGETLTISKFLPNQNTNIIETVVGNLNHILKEDPNDRTDYGYGLYGQNVFLTGTLTTQVSDTSYAGVNTLNGVTSTLEDVTGNIVFWAGAQGKSAQSIQAAPFQVTDSGHLYAKNGIFEGSVLIDATIEGADLRIARIHGYNNEEKIGSSLRFYNAARGIGFYKGDDYYKGDAEDRSVLVWSINENGFTDSNDNQFLTIDNSGVSVNLNEIKVGNLLLSENNIKYVDITTDPVSYPTSIAINQTDFEIILNNLNKITVTANQTIIANNLYGSADIFYGEGINEMHYMKVSDGYDLYIGG